MPNTVQQQMYTTFTNASGIRRPFSYLPPHGKELDAGESVSIPGDLVDKLAGLSRQGKFNALQADLTSGAATIVRPALTA
jgi:hypothetical protein